MRVLVTGSTTWTDVAAIHRELSQLPPGSIVIHGDCAGVDTLAEDVAVELGLAVEGWVKSPADFRKYRQDSWKGLNERMLASGVTLVLAFHPEWNVDGKAHGTRHLLKLAQTAGVEVRAFDR